MYGESQALNGPPSTLHWKPTPLPVNVNVGVVSPVVPLGPPVIVVSSVPVPVQLRDAGERSALPAASNARTRSVCVPATAGGV